MTPSEILAVPISRPGQVLGKDFESGFKKLMRVWHPDLNKDPKAADVALHLNLLLKSARKLEKNGGYDRVLELGGKRNETYYYSAEVITDTGSLFICDNHLIWRTKRSDDDLAKRSVETVKTFGWPNIKLEEEFQRYIPRNLHCLATADWTYTIVSKSKEVIRLADILEKKGPLPPKAVAWILSSMYNFACWLSVSKISHYGFTIENYFIEADTHVGALLGGWCFSAPRGQKPLAAPRSVKLVMPDLASMHRDQVHLALIKAAGRQMLGHKSLSTLRRDDNIPKALRDWLIAPGGTKPIDEYRRWHEVISVAFGGRHFTKYDITAADVYGED